MRFKDLQRWDLTYNQSVNFDETNKSEPKYPLVKLGEILDINPSVDFKQFISGNKDVSFLPMQNVCSDGVTFNAIEKPAKDSKGFVKFQDDDLLWAKITPCMQNKKSDVVKNLKYSVGFGSTEFFVMRSKNNNKTDINFILHFFKNRYINRASKAKFQRFCWTTKGAKGFFAKF